MGFAALKNLAVEKMKGGLGCGSVNLSAESIVYKLVAESQLARLGLYLVDAAVQVVEVLGGLEVPTANVKCASNHDTVIGSRLVPGGEIMVEPIPRNTEDHR